MQLMNGCRYTQRRKTISFAVRLFLVVSVVVFFVAGCAGVNARQTEENDIEDGTQESIVRQSEGKDITVLYTGDVHCGVDAGFGYAGVQAIRESLEASGEEVLLVDVGDAIEGGPLGTLTEGEAIIDLMNVLKYDVAIPGNHEFNYGMDQFFALTEKAEFPYLSCNFVRDGEAVFAPYRIEEIGGKKIGFVGVTTPHTIHTSVPAYFQDGNGKFIYGFLQDETGESVYEAVQKAVDGARADGADYVIVLGHMGNGDKFSPWNYADVITHTTGIDAFLDGHSHDRDQVTVKDLDGKDVPRGASGTKLNGIGWLKISADEGDLAIGVWTWDNDVSAPNLFEIENEAGDAVKDALDGLAEDLKKDIGRTDYDLVIDDPVATDEQGQPIRIVRRAETNLGDLVADAYREVTGADIAFVNGGSLCANLPEGSVTGEDILGVLPYSNRISVAEVTGQQILDALEWGVHEFPESSGGFLQVSGLTYEFDPETESRCTADESGLFTGVEGAYRVRNVMVDGKSLDMDKMYTLASTSYVLKFQGDGFAMFDAAQVIMDGVKLDYETLTDYFEEALGGVAGTAYENPYGQGRIVEEGQ